MLKSQLRKHSVQRKKQPSLKRKVPSSTAAGWRQRWSKDEVGVLLDGVKKHGIGNWKNILTDTEFAPFLKRRSNVDIKDKWRNLVRSLSRTASRGSGEKATAPEQQGSDETDQDIEFTS